MQLDHWNPLSYCNENLCIRKRTARQIFMSILKDEQLPVTVVFCNIKMHQKRHIFYFRKYRMISLKFAIQLHHWKR